jgi:type I restriction enzyme R subunit
MSLNEWELSEKPAIENFESLGYEYKPGGKIAPDGEDPERKSLSDVVLRDRLRWKLQELNPELPEPVIEEAMAELLGFNSPKIIRNNRNFHENLVGGVHIEYEKGGEQRGDFVDIIDFETPENNDFLVTNQFWIQIGDNNKRRPDLLFFINGLPIGIVENKNPTDPNATIQSAYRQVTNTYKRDIPDLFHYLEFIVVMDQSNARIGTLTTPWEWYSKWNYIAEEGDEYPELPPAEVLIRGAFDKKRVVDLIKNFIIFDEEDGKTTKKLSAYHQYYGVREAVKSTEQVVPDEDENRIGVFWHTQGSGKSLSMLFYTKTVRQLDELRNPTLVFVTDRNDLDEQLHDTFADSDFRTQWADSRDHLRDLLDREAGGIIFTTIQKFQTKDGEHEYPRINERQNVIVVADEAHRSQYKKLAGNLRRALPNASFLGFTATPIQKEDRSTRRTFGNHVSEYPIDRSEEDGSTVPIYYEARFAKLQYNRDEVSDRVRELLESESDDLENEIVGKWTDLRTLIENNDDRFEKISQDIVEHFQNRELDGKAMVVAISREAAVKYKRHIDSIDGAPEAEVVISNPDEYIDNPLSEDKLKRRFKDDEDPLKIAVVCKKWTTGFDVPCLHTMYIDRPAKNHDLLQTIGRVNRKYKDKDGGLIVDYIGIADNLKKALDKYTSDIQEQAMADIEMAVETMHRKHEKVTDFFEDTDYDDWQEKEGAELQRLCHRAQNEVLEPKDPTENREDRKKDFMDAVTQLEKAFSLVTPHEEAEEIRSDVVFFRGIKDTLRSIERNESEPGDVEEIDTAIKEIISNGISAEDVVQVAGFENWKEGKPVLSDEFLKDVENIEHGNLQVELLKKLIRGEISARKRSNISKYQNFEESLEETVNKYNNRSISTQEVIDELRQYAEELQEEERREERLDLSEEELAFYDAIASNTEQDIDEEVLREIAKEIKELLQENVEVDWTNRTKMQSKIKREVKALLREKGLKHSQYDPLIEPIVTQAEALYGSV